MALSTGITTSPSSQTTAAASPTSDDTVKIVVPLVVVFVILIVIAILIIVRVCKRRQRDKNTERMKPRKKPRISESTLDPPSLLQNGSQTPKSRRRGDLDKPNEDFKNLKEKKKTTCGVLNEPYVQRSFESNTAPRQIDGVDSGLRKNDIFGSTPELGTPPAPPFSTEENNEWLNNTTDRLTQKSKSCPRQIGGLDTPRRKIEGLDPPPRREIEGLEPPKLPRRDSRFNNAPGLSLPPTETQPSELFSDREENENFEAILPPDAQQDEPSTVQEDYEQMYKPEDFENGIKGVDNPGFHTSNDLDSHYQNVNEIRNHQYF